MLNYLWVALGGAVGSVARFWASGFIIRHWGDRFPFGTLLVNVTGSLLIGFFATAMAPEGRWLATTGFRVFFIAGVCGGYTTFSSFSLETLNLARDREWLFAGLNVLGSTALCLAAVWLGHMIAAAINQRH